MSSKFEFRQLIAKKRNYFDVNNKDREKNSENVS
jgi:hypothetical protein